MKYTHKCWRTWPISLQGLKSLKHHCVFLRTWRKQVPLLSFRKGVKESPGNSRADQHHLYPSKGEGTNNPGKLMVYKLNINQKSSLAAKANNNVDCIRNTVSMLSTAILHLYSALVRNIWNSRSNPGLPGISKIQAYWSKYNKEQRGWLRHRSTFHMRRCWENRGCSAWGIFGRSYHCV